MIAARPLRPDLRKNNLTVSGQLTVVDHCIRGARNLGPPLLASEKVSVRIFFAHLKCASTQPDGTGPPRYLSTDINPVHKIAIGIRPIQLRYVNVLRTMHRLDSHHRKTNVEHLTAIRLGADSNPLSH